MEYGWTPPRTATRVDLKLYGWTPSMDEAKKEFRVCVVSEVGGSEVGIQGKMHLNEMLVS